MPQGQVQLDPVGHRLIERDRSHLIFSRLGCIRQREDKGLTVISVQTDLEPDGLRGQLRQCKTSVRSGLGSPDLTVCKSCHDLRTGQRIASLILDLTGDGDHRRLLPLRQGKRDGRILRSRRDSLPRRLLILLQQGFAQNHLADVCALRLSAGEGISRPGGGGSIRLVPVDCEALRHWLTCGGQDLGGEGAGLGGSAEILEVVAPLHRPLVDRALLIAVDREGAPSDAEHRAGMDLCIRVIEGDVSEIIAILERGVVHIFHRLFQHHGFQILTADKHTADDPRRGDCHALQLAAPVEGVPIAVHSGISGNRSRDRNGGEAAIAKGFTVQRGEGSREIDGGQGRTIPKGPLADARHSFAQFH